MFSPLLEKAGDDDYVGLSIQHACFDEGCSKSRPTKHHAKPYFVNKSKKRFIDYKEFSEALEKIEQSNQKFSLDGEMILKLYISNPKFTGGGRKSVKQSNRLLNIIRTFAEDEEYDHRLANIQNSIAENGAESEPSISEPDDDNEDLLNALPRNRFVLDEADEDDIDDDEFYPASINFNENLVISENYNDDDEIYLTDIRHQSKILEHFSKAKNYYQIQNSDNACGWLAFGLGLYIADNPDCNSKKSRSRYQTFRRLRNPKDNYKALRDYLSSRLTEVNDIDISSRMREIDLGRLQSCFQGYKIIVFHRPLRFKQLTLKVMFSNTSVPITTEKKIILEYVRNEEPNGGFTLDGHFSTIHPNYVFSYCPRISNRYFRSFCFKCNKPFYDALHNCSKTKCRACLSDPSCVPGESRDCENCGQTTVSLACFENHKRTTCKIFKKCHNCKRSIRSTNFKLHEKVNCREVCFTCGIEKEDYPHYHTLKCPNKQRLLLEDAKPRIIVSYDIECEINDISDSDHGTYMLGCYVTCDYCYDLVTHTRKQFDCRVCAHHATSDGFHVWKGETCMDKFFGFLK